MSGLDCLAVFRSIHDVMKAESLLIEERIPQDLIPTPRPLSSSCGMALVFRPGDRERVVELLTAHRTEPLSLHHRAEDGWQSLTAAPDERP